MICGKVVLCGALLMLVGLSGSVAQSSSTKEPAKEIPVTESTTSPAAQSGEAETVAPERANATNILSVLRLELAKRRLERQQRQEQRALERREQILRTLESLSDRKREYELRRQEALLDAEALREARRQEMEARRVGRLPAAERERLNRARLAQLAEETPQEENEIGSSMGDGAGDDDLTREVASEAVQRVRNLLLIEEANGNLRLIDLDTEEGQQYVLEGVKSGADGEATDGEEGEEKATEEKVNEETEKIVQVLKRKLKSGQI